MLLAPGEYENRGARPANRFPAGRRRAAASAPKGAVPAGAGFHGGGGLLRHLATP
jgi:hypothetical protein